MSLLRRRRALEAELLEWMEAARREGFAATRDEARFEDLALRLFALQTEGCPAYRRFCAGRGVTSEGLGDWRRIPSVPTGAFKELALCGFDPDRAVAVFRTSGTSTRVRGALYLDTLEVYHASLIASLEQLLLPDLAAGSRTGIRVLAPSPDEAPDSSLSHMFGRLVGLRGDDASGFDVVDGELDTASLDRSVDRACADGRPLVLCGTAFAFVHWLDGLEARGRRVSLPEGSRLMETGGFKGRSREVQREALVAALSERLGIPPARIVNQYGMTELGSQFYDSVLADPAGPRRKLGPPWTRVRILEPGTGAEVPAGEVGVIHVFDLANTGSVSALATADRGRAVPAREGPGLPGQAGFEVLGRAEGAEARGCSLAADAMLGAS